MPVWNLVHCVSIGLYWCFLPVSSSPLFPGPITGWVGGGVGLVYFPALEEVWFIALASVDAVYGTGNELMLWGLVTWPLSDLQIQLPSSVRADPPACETLSSLPHTILEWPCYCGEPSDLSVFLFPSAITSVSLLAKFALGLPWTWCIFSRL